MKFPYLTGNWLGCDNISKVFSSDDEDEFLSPKKRHFKKKKAQNSTRSQKIFTNYIVRLSVAMLPKCNESGKIHQFVVKCTFVLIAKLG
jgi:hypothetical protein